MDRKEEQLSRKIEEARGRLEALLKIKERNDLDIVKASQALDLIINKYYELLKRKAN